MLGKLVCRGEIGGVAVGRGSSVVAARRAKYKMRGSAIRDKMDFLGDTRDKMRGFDPGMHVSNGMVARSIKASDILKTSSRRSDRSDKVGRFNGGSGTSEISCLPNRIETIWG